MKAIEIITKVDLRRPDRRIGNTTRQIDFAIDALFSGYKVKALDHWNNGHHEEANKNLFRRILERLRVEHNLQYMIENKQIEIDKRNLTLTLKEIS